MGSLNRESILLMSGICISVIYFLNLIILAALYPEYSHMTNLVSDLGRIEAPHHKIFNAVIFLTGLLFLMTGLGFFYSVNRITSRKVLAALIGSFVAVFGVSLFFAALFPLPDPRHLAYGIGLLTLLTPLLLAWAFWRVGDSRTFSFLQILSFILILLSIIASNALSSDMNVGLFQRIQAVAIFGWLLYSCFGLMRYKRA